MTMKLGNYKDNDVELCRTTNSRVSTHTAEALLEQHIPFTKNSKKIPFFKREIYQGADTLWVITIDHAACLPVSAWIDGDHPEGICPLVDFPLEKRNLFTFLFKCNVMFKK